VLKDDKNLSNYGIVAEVESSEDEENENEELKALNNKDSLRQYVIHCAVSDVLENEV